MPLGQNTAAFFCAMEKAAAAQQPTPISDMTIEELRESSKGFYEGEGALCGALPESVDETMFVKNEIDVDDIKIPIITYTPEQYQRDKSSTLLFFPGEGFTAPLLKAHFPGIATLANQCGCKVIAIDYLLAPEHTLQKIKDTAFKAVENIFYNPEKYNINPNNLNIMGYSSGGNISASLVSMSINRGRTINFKKHILMSPWLDLSLETHKQPEFADAQNEDKMLTTEALEALVKFTLNADDNAKSAEVSPLYAPADDLPETTIISPQYDGLRGDAVRYAEKSNRIKLITCNGQTHNFFIARGVLDDGENPAEIAAKVLRAK